MAITILVNEKRWMKLRRLERSVGEWFVSRLQALIEDPTRHESEPWFWMVKYREETGRDPFHSGWFPFSKFVGAPTTHTKHKTITTEPGFSEQVRLLCSQYGMTMGELIRELLEDRCLSLSECKRKFDYWKTGGILEEVPNRKTKREPQSPDFDKLKEENKKLRVRVTELKHSVDAAYDMGKMISNYIMSMPSYPEHLNSCLSFFRSPSSSRDKQIDSEKTETGS